MTSGLLTQGKFAGTISEREYFDLENANIPD